VYAARRRAEGGDEVRPARKRGPVGACTDEELAKKIRELLAESPWVGEGYRKVWARLRISGVRTARRRVLRVMREHDLLATQRSLRRRGPKSHDRTIIPEAPNTMWGTDMTTAVTGEGTAAIFFVLDHWSGECLGIHAAVRGTRYEALEPLRQAVRERFGGFAPGVATGQGLAVRHDHGSQFVSRAYQEELRLLGIRSSPSFVGQPQGNGCAERFVRTLKEQLLWLQRFDTVDELQQALREFKELYNEHWIMIRHDFKSPRERYREYQRARGERAA